MGDSGMTFSILSHLGTFCSIPPRCRRRHQPPRTRWSASSPSRSLARLVVDDPSLCVILCRPSGVRTQPARHRNDSDRCRTLIAARIKKAPGSGASKKSATISGSRCPRRVDTILVTKAQNCYLAIAAIRPDLPQGSTMATCGRVASGAG
jgi:hypothetical protein